MLLGAVLLWALNVTVTKYMFDHGWQPLAYGLGLSAGPVVGRALAVGRVRVRGALDIDMAA
jgi:hypothetical protein